MDAIMQDAETLGVTSQELENYQKVLNAKEKRYFDEETKLIEHSREQAKRSREESSNDDEEVNEPVIKKARTMVNDYLDKYIFPSGRREEALVQIRLVLDLFVSEQGITQFTYRERQEFKTLWNAIDASAQKMSDIAGFSHAYASVVAWDAFLALPLYDASKVPLNSGNRKSLSELVPDYKKWIARWLVAMTNSSHWEALQFLLAVINMAAIKGDMKDYSFLAALVDVLTDELPESVMMSTFDSHALKSVVVCLFTRLPTTYMKFHVIKKPSLSDGSFDFEEQGFEMYTIYNNDFQFSFPLDIIGDAPNLLGVVDKCREIVENRTKSEAPF